MNVIDGSALVGKVAFPLHNAVHILLCSLFRFCKRLIPLLVYKPFLLVRIHDYLIRRGHQAVIAPYILRGKPFRFFRESIYISPIF